MRFSKKNKSVGQFLIDLTPLLDVVFILLIVVLSFQFNENAKANELKQEEPEKSVEADNKLKSYEEQLSIYNDMYSYVNVITISATYEPTNRKYRTIHILSNDNEVETIDLNPSNETDAWKQCQKRIETIANSSGDVPTIISIRNERMLYRDEQAITNLSTIDGIYFKNNMELENE